MLLYQSIVIKMVINIPSVLQLIVKSCDTILIISRILLLCTLIGSRNT